MSNILAMLPMTSSQVHLWSIGLWMLIGVLIISPTAGGGGLGRLRCNVDSEGGKYTSASPRCTCLPPRQHCAEVALGAFTTDSSAMLTRREASTPRLRLGVLASLLVNIALKLHSEESKYTSATPRCTCFPPRATSTQVPLVQVQVPKSNSASPRWTWGLGLGLGGLERSRPSPPPPAVGLIPKFVLDNRLFKFVLNSFWATVFSNLLNFVLNLFWATVFLNWFWNWSNVG